MIWNLIILSIPINFFSILAFLDFFEMEYKNWKILLAVLISSIMYNVIICGFVILSIVLILLGSLLQGELPGETLKRIKNEINNIK